LLIWLNENVELRSTFSRHGNIKTSFLLLIWLNENVELRSTFSRHGNIKTSFLLLIWLNENVHFVAARNEVKHQGAKDDQIDEQTRLLS
jgi:hypothetical protein